MTASRPRRLWSPLPDGNQRRLIELLLASRPDAEMLARWADDVDIQALDDGSARLLPALYLKLTAAGIDHPWLPIMRGWYRRTLYIATGFWSIAGWIWSTDWRRGAFPACCSRAPRSQASTIAISAPGRWAMSIS